MAERSLELVDLGAVALDLVAQILRLPGRARGELLERFSLSAEGRDLGFEDLAPCGEVLHLADLGHVAAGQRLAITADLYPGRTFEGVVTSINQQAEFTPRNVQTQSDRLNLVFGVQATVENADGALKPGMPVDARFEAGAR